MDRKRRRVLNVVELDSNQFFGGNFDTFVSLEKRHDAFSAESSDESSSGDSSDIEMETQLDSTYSQPIFCEEINRLKKRQGKKIKNKQSGGLLYAKETLQTKIGRDLAVNCCDLQCTKKLSLSTVKTCRDEFYQKSQMAQRNFILNQLKLTTIDGISSSETVLAVCGKPVCLKGWRLVYGIKTRRYAYLKKRVLQRKDVDVENSRIGQLYRSKRYLVACQFLTDYAKLFGDNQPDCIEVHLPSCVTKASVFNEYKLKCEATNQPLFKQRRFYELWDADFSYLKIRKYSKFTKCTPCTIFRKALLKKPSKEEKQKLIEMRTLHLSLQSLCRQKYYKHNNKAKECPDRYLSLIIDNMDQAKTNLPSFMEPSKKDANLPKMHHHLTGVLCQSEELHSYAFTWTDKFPSDANITINSLVTVLDDVSKRNGKLPPTLYIQADNSGKDNKNNFVILFLASLVKAKIFKKIKLMFLMVGHTHEDIDQMFSKISTRLHERNAITLPELHHAIQENFHPVPQVKHLDSIWNFKESCRGARKLQGIQTPHCFVLKLGENGDVTLKYKDWPLSEEHYRSVILPDVPDLCQPTPVEANTSSLLPTIEKLNRSLQTYRDAGKMSDVDVAWWKEHLQQEQNQYQPTVPLPTELLQYSEVPNEPAVVNGSLREAINCHISKLQHESLVRLGSQRIRL